MKRLRSTAAHLALPTLLAAALVAPATAGAHPVAEPVLAASVQNSIVWGTCASPPAGVPDGGQKCGTVTVPVNYSNPNGATINIAVSRISAANPSLRRGVLLLNPGGPGGSGIDLPRLLGARMDSSVRDRYDLIGFDPRGVNNSAPVTCGITDSKVERVVPWLLPGGVQENYELAQDTAQKCADNAGSMLPYITTLNTARDMDRIRIALGETKISYLGYSYGTGLGAVYATIFPSRTDRFVLDSVVDLSSGYRNAWRNWGPGVEARFPDLTSWVAARNSTYGIGSTSAAVRSRYFAIAAYLDQHPLPLPPGFVPGNVLTGNVFRTVSFTALYSDEAFADAARIWSIANIFANFGSLSTSNVTSLASALTSAAQHDLNLPSLAAAPDNEYAAQFAVMCDDDAWPQDVATYVSDVAADSQQYPVAGAMAANTFACAAWHYSPRESLPAISSTGPRNILMVNNRRDPVTPLFGAKHVNQLFGARSRLITAEAGGHTTYLILSNACVTSKVNNFLVNGTMPSQDVTCAS